LQLLSHETSFVVKKSCCKLFARLRRPALKFLT
jgi:hypothetical protein